jgi:hypothetical protein
MPLKNSPYWLAPSCNVPLDVGTVPEAALVATALPLR